ncbi:cytochrome P450 [Streptomyces sp. NPDC021969]|uniref:cytochrome P450 n=1 Tax=unclassified Streptomyces TaxID=2593676 RepID=UPI0033EE275B
MDSETGTPLSFPFAEHAVMEIEPEYELLRKRSGMARVTVPHGDEAWLATRMAEVKKVLGDPRFSREATADPDAPRYTRQAMAALDVVVTMDPPRHTRVRKLLNKAMTNKRAEDLAPEVAAVADELVDEIMAQGAPGDLVEKFGLELPLRVLAALFGVPDDEYGRFKDLVHDMVATGTGQQLGAYFFELLGRRQAERGDDLLSALLDVREGDDRLTDMEIIINAVTMVVAGYETTSSELCGMLYVLLRHPEQLSYLVAHPDRVPGAVEELLRFTPMTSTGTNPAIATEDVTIGDAVIRKGEAVLACLVSANRDEEAFENPQVLDTTRDTAVPHVSFGFGPHYCVGARLARIELQTGVGTVLRRMPDLALAVPEDQISLASGFVMRRLAGLPVTW